MLSSRDFVVLGLTFRSLNHFKFIFVYGMKECYSFIVLHMVIQLSQHHLKRLSFLHCLSCPLCYRLIDCRCVDLFLGSLFCAIDLCICFCVNTMLSWLLQPCSLKSGRLMPPVCSFVSELVWHLKSLVIPYKF